MIGTLDHVIGWLGLFLLMYVATVQTVQAYQLRQLWKTVRDLVKQHQGSGKGQLLYTGRYGFPVDTQIRKQ